MEIYVITSSENFNNVGVIVSDSKNVCFRGSNKLNQEALDLLLNKQLMVEELDDKENVFMTPVNLKNPENLVHYIRELPNYWFVTKHIKLADANKDELFRTYCGTADTGWRTI